MVVSQTGLGCGWSYCTLVLWRGKQAAQIPNRLADALQGWRVNRFCRSKKRFKKLLNYTLMTSAYVFIFCSFLLIHNRPILNVYTQLHQLYGQASRAISTG